jgi:hypothetical protein
MSVTTHSLHGRSTNVSHAMAPIDHADVLALHAYLRTLRAAIRRIPRGALHLAATESDRGWRSSRRATVRAMSRLQTVRRHDICHEIDHRPAVATLLVALRAHRQGVGLHLHQNPRVMVPQAGNVAGMVLRHVVNQTILLENVTTPQDHAKPLTWVQPHAPGGNPMDLGHFRVTTFHHPAVSLLTNREILPGARPRQVLPPAIDPTYSVRPRNPAADVAPVRYRMVGNRGNPGSIMRLANRGNRGNRAMALHLEVAEAEEVALMGHRPPVAGHRHMTHAQGPALAPRVIITTGMAPLRTHLHHAITGSEAHHPESVIASSANASHVALLPKDPTFATVARLHSARITLAQPHILKRDSSTMPVHVRVLVAPEAQRQAERADGARREEGRSRISRSLWKAARKPLLRWTPLRKRDCSSLIRMCRK